MSLRNQLLAVREQFGQLTPAAVVETARAEEHPLHSRFEWDDAVAGEKYRHDQARRLIQSVLLPVKRGGEKPPSELRAFVSVQREEGFIYEPIEEVAADPFAQQLVLTNMRREIKQMRDRYKHYDEFFAELREVLAEAG